MPDRPTPEELADHHMVAHLAHRSELLDEAFRGKIKEMMVGAIREDRQRPPDIPLPVLLSGEEVVRLRGWANKGAPDVLFPLLSKLLDENAHLKALLSDLADDSHADLYMVGFRAGLSLNKVWLLCWDNSLGYADHDEVEIGVFSSEEEVDRKIGALQEQGYYLGDGPGRFVRYPCQINGEIG